MRVETLQYAADGLDMRGQLFLDGSQGLRPGVLVFPEAYGLNKHALSRAEKLASLGYAALACDLHGSATVVEDLAASIAMLDGLYADPSKTRARAAGGLKALAEHSEVDATRIAAIGFCFGGTMALELARSGADIKAVVGFHSGLATVLPLPSPGIVRARILVCIGGDDPFIPPEQRGAFEEEMRRGAVDWQINIYGNTVHSFTNPGAANAKMPEAVRYNPTSDARSWLSMKRLFDEVLP